MLIDTRDEPPEPNGPRREPWLLKLVLDHLFPWPVVVLWLMAAGLLLDGWVAVLCSWTGVGVAFWRMSRALDNAGGMRDHVQ